MPTWRRSRGAYLTKTTDLTDGEMLHLILGLSPQVTTDLDDRFYLSLQHIKSTTAKALLWIAASCSFGNLAHFGVLTSASASGLDIAPSVFSPTALLAISITTTWFCFSYSKQTYLQSWFHAKIRRAVPAYKARMLALYPDAFWHFHYLPSSIGYPKHIFGKRKGYGQLLYLVVFTIALLLASLSSFALWIMVALDVIHSTALNDFASYAIVGLSFSIVLVGWSSPFYYDTARQYRHHGLVNRLAKLEGEELMTAHRKIALVALKMGLVSGD